MKQQTAIGCLYKELFPKKLDGFSEEEWNKIDTAFKEALKKEKEQIINAYKVGRAEAFMPIEKETTGQQYFNQTYNNQ